MMIVALGGRIPAFNVAFAGWLVAAFFFGLTSFTVKGDLRRRNERLARSMLPETSSKAARTTTTTTNESSDGTTNNSPLADSVDDSERFDQVALV